MKTQGNSRPKAARAGPAALLLALGAGAACSGGSARDPAAEPVPDSNVDAAPAAAVGFDSIFASAQSGVQEPLREIVRNVEAWAAVRPSLTAARTPSPPLPEVDFDRHMLVAVGLGTRPSGGYAVRVAGIAAAAGKLRVTVLEVAPGPGCMATMALTAPVIVLRTARFDGDVEFVEAREERPCD